MGSTILIVTATVILLLLAGSQNFELNNKHILFVGIARYVLYILTVQLMYGACAVLYDVIRNKRALDGQLLSHVNRQHVIICLAAIGYLLHREQSLLDNSFFFILIPDVAVKYPGIESEKNNKVTVKYSVGMACSYFEGYLVHVIPSDGAKFVGFQENIRVYEARQGVVFPVKKLFVVVTKSLYGPPALQDFTRSDREGVANLEACSSLSEIEKDVAGVKNRFYNNTAYKIHRPNRRPVCLAAQGGTPMHTLYKVMRNRDLSEELAGLNKEEIVDEFLTTLRKLIDKSPECRDKCELIYFDVTENGEILKLVTTVPTGDKWEFHKKIFPLVTSGDVTNDTDPEQNLAEVLLDRIRELEPNFEEIIATPR